MKLLKYCIALIEIVMLFVVFKESFERQARIAKKKLYKKNIDVTRDINEGVVGYTGIYNEIAISDLAYRPKRPYWTQNQEASKH